MLLIQILPFPEHLKKGKYCFSEELQGSGEALPVFCGTLAADLPSQLFHSSHLTEAVLFPKMLYRITISSCCFLSPLIQIWSEIGVKQGTVLLLKLAAAAAATGIYISE